MLSRLKFDMSALVDEILDRLPPEVWSSNSTTFLDPAIGGGQFVAEIERRLRAHGHSDSNIHSRVFGYERGPVAIRYAVNKHKLVGNYTCKTAVEFLELDTDMQFDVVVGNPPFQSNSAGRAEKLWPKFISRAFDICKPDGIVAIISPTSWTAGSKNISKGSTGVLSDIFQVYDIQRINLDVREHFPTVGTHIGYFIGTKRPNTGKTLVNDRVINLQDFDILPSGSANFDVRFTILEKVMRFPTKFQVNSYTGGGANRKQGLDQETPTHTHKTYVRGGNLGSVNWAYFTGVENPKHAHKRKVIIPISGAEKFMPFIDTQGVAFSLSCYIVELEDHESLAGACSVFYSKFFRFLIEGYRTSGFIQIQIVKNLPRINMDREYSDQDIYRIMNLTSAETEYIENTIRDL